MLERLHFRIQCGCLVLVIDSVNSFDTATPQVEINQLDDECVYDDVNTYSSTGTGDSGFGDSKEFLKVSLQGHYEPPQTFNTQAQTSLPQSHSYAPLNVSTVNAGYYKSLRRDGIQGRYYRYAYRCAHTV